MSTTAAPADPPIPQPAPPAALWWYGLAEDPEGPRVFLARPVPAPDAAAARGALLAWLERDWAPARAAATLEVRGPLAELLEAHVLEAVGRPALDQRVHGAPRPAPAVFERLRQRYGLPEIEGELRAALVRGDVELTEDRDATGPILGRAPDQHGKLLRLRRSAERLLHLELLAAIEAETCSAEGAPLHVVMAGLERMAARGRRDAQPIVDAAVRAGVIELRRGESLSSGAPLGPTYVRIASAATSGIEARMLAAIAKLADTDGDAPTYLVARELLRAGYNAPQIEEAFRVAEERGKIGCGFDPRMRDGGDNATLRPYVGRLVWAKRAAMAGGAS